LGKANTLGYLEQQQTDTISQILFEYNAPLSIDVYKAT